MRMVGAPSASTAPSKEAMHLSFIGQEVRQLGFVSLAAVAQLGRVVAGIGVLLTKHDICHHIAGSDAMWLSIDSNVMLLKHGNCLVNKLSCSSMLGSARLLFSQIISYTCDWQPIVPRKHILAFVQEDLRVLENGKPLVRIKEAPVSARLLFV